VFFTFYKSIKFASGPFSLHSFNPEASFPAHNKERGGKYEFIIFFRKVTKTDNILQDETGKTPNQQGLTIVSAHSLTVTCQP
jgi:hypothetical protein